MLTFVRSHFTSPTLFPSAPPLPTPALRLTAPLSSGAHPLITHLSCATIHPHDPSCARTFLSYLLVTLPALTRSFLVIHSALLVLTRLKALHNAPVAVLRALFARSLRFALFATGAIGTAWASICASQHLLPGRVLSRARFAIGGALAGLWAFLVQDRHRGRQLGVRGRRKSSARMLRPAGGRVSGGPSGSRQLFLYSARIAGESFWRVGVAHRWWRPIKGGDVLVFVAALGLVGAVYEKEREGLANRRRERAAVVRRQRRLLKELGEEDAARGEDESADDPELAAKAWMKGFRWIRGEGWGVDEEIDGSVNDGEDRFS